MRTPFDAELPNLTWYKTCGEGRVSWVQPRLPSQESGVLAIPNLWDSPVFMTIPFNAERPKLA